MNKVSMFLLFIRSERIKMARYFPSMMFPDLDQSCLQLEGGASNTMDSSTEKLSSLSKLTLLYLTGTQRLDSQGKAKESSILLALLETVDAKPCYFFFFNLICKFRLLAFSNFLQRTCKPTDSYWLPLSLLASSWSSPKGSSQISYIQSFWKYGQMLSYTLYRDCIQLQLYNKLLVKKSD